VVSAGCLAHVTIIKLIIIIIIIREKWGDDQVLVAADGLKLMTHLAPKVRVLSVSTVSTAIDNTDYNI